MREKDRNIKRVVIELLLAAITALAFYSFQINSKSYTVYLEVTAQISEDDHYQIFYTDSSAYDQEHSIVTAVSKKEGFQKIYFVLPKDSVLNTFRFDPGNKVGKILVKEIRIMVPGKEIVWNSEQILSSFIPNSDIQGFISKDSIAHISSRGNDPHLFLKVGIRKKYQDLITYAEVNYKVLPICYSMAAFVLIFIVLSVSGKAKRLLFFSNPDAALVGIFFVLITLPLLNMMFGLIPEAENHEKRVLSSKPIYYQQSILEYPKQFTHYFDDNFGFRSLMIKLNSYFKIKVLRSSPIPEKVILGKEDWLFLSSFGDPMLLAQPLFKEEELEVLERDLEQRTVTLKKAGIDYYVLVTPDKSLIYPEYLPTAYRSRNVNARMDQFFDRIKQNKNINAIDLRPSLMNLKSNRELYYSTDTHWNIYAAMHSYEEVMNIVKKNNPEISFRPFTEYEFFLEEESGGDLCALFNSPELFTKKVWLPKLKGQKKVFDMSEFKPDYHKKFTVLNADTVKTKKIFFYHDSFGLFFVKPATMDFKEATFSWTTDFSYKDMEEHKPDIVIHEVVSRFMPSLKDK